MGSFSRPAVLIWLRHCRYEETRYWRVRWYEIAQQSSSKRTVAVYRSSANAASFCVSQSLKTNVRCANRIERPLKVQRTHNVIGSDRNKSSMPIYTSPVTSYDDKFVVLLQIVRAHLGWEKNLLHSDHTDLIGLRVWSTLNLPRSI